MKVILANPATRVAIDDEYERYFIKAGSRWPWSTTKRKDEKNTNIFFPFYLAYTAAILRNAGHEVHIIDGVAMDLPEIDFLERVLAVSPHVVVLETTTHAVSSDLVLAAKIKSILPKVKVVMTGPHATVFANDILNRNSVIDFAALGEYEFTVAELMNKLANGVDLSDIKGLLRRENNEIRGNSERGFIPDINLLPRPAFDLFPCNDKPDLAIYTDGICTYRPAVTLHSSRGCPFKCDFCLWNQVMYGNGKYRMFEPKRVVDEMEHVIKDFDAREIYFDDDDFCVNKKHVIEICDEIISRRLAIKWSCMGDAMSTDEEMIKAMSAAGCIFMKFGVESGNEDILKNIGKPLKPDKAIETSKLCRKYGIRTHATFTFGLDGETIETMKDTLRLANRIKFDYAQASITTPFPGTRYYSKLVEKGFLKDLEWDRFDGTSSCVFDTTFLTGKQIEDFRRKAIRSMVMHKIIDPGWLRRYIARNIIVLKNQGIQPVLAPVKAMYQTFIKR